MVLRVLFGAWLLPAASLIWIGLATTGFRETGETSLALALGRTQAISLLLAVFTILIGASAAVRQQTPADREPPEAAVGRSLDGPVVDLAPEAVDVPVAAAAARFGWLAGHAAAGALAMLMAAAAAIGLGPLEIVLPIAAVLGLVGGLALPRALLRCRSGHGGPLAVLAIAVVFQLSIGWLHVVHPAGMASPLLAVEGVLLAWAATAAARMDPFVEPAPLWAPVPPPEPVAGAATVGVVGRAGFSLRPARPPRSGVPAGR